jgi:hypothetical protein
MMLDAKHGNAPLHAPNKRVVENHYHALSLYFVFYNFVRVHKSLRTSPAMAAGVADRLWSMEDVAVLVENVEVQKLTLKRAALLAS